MEDKILNFTIKTNEEIDLTTVIARNEAIQNTPSLVERVGVRESTIKSITITNNNPFVVKNVYPTVVAISASPASVADISDVHKGWDLYPNETIEINYESEYAKHKINLHERKDIGVRSPLPILKIENKTRNEIIDLPADRTVTSLKFDGNKLSLSDEVYIYYLLSNSYITDFKETGSIAVMSEFDCSLEIEFNLEDIKYFKPEWRNKTNTGYEAIDFNDIEFFQERVLTDIDYHLQGKVEGTDYPKSEMSYKQRAFLNGIICKSKPKVIVEMGVAAGGSSCVILNAIKDIPDAKLYSFDINRTWYRDINKPNGRKTGFLVESHMPDLIHKWELVINDVPSTVFERVLPESGVDICLLDTAHANPGEHLNILEILPFMKKNGIIIYHDTAYHTFKFPEGSTCCNSINTLEGKRILLKSENSFSLPNISAVILSENIENMKYKLFTNLTLPWRYNISKIEFRKLLDLYSRYYPQDQINLFIFYFHFYSNGGLQKRDTAYAIAEHETKLFLDQIS